MTSATFTDLRGNVCTVSGKSKRGAFSRVILTGEHAYIFCADDCFDKELLCLIDSDNPHIPHCERVGETATGQVYKMPQYKPLTAKDSRAWADFKRLNSLFRSALLVSINHPFDAYKRAERMIELMGEDESPLFEAFVLLNSWAQSYGAQYCVEIFKRNLAVDNSGNLVLLDCFFDYEKNQKKWNK
jgi:hypothetical protein